MRRLACGFLLIAAACTEQATAPGDCPNFCPGGSIVVKDSIFTAIIERDSAFRGYVQAYEGDAMTAADLPGVQSRAVFVLSDMITRIAPKATDTTTVPVFADSSLLRLTIVRRNPTTTNLWVKLYRIPATTDSTASFASLDPYFTAQPIDSVNVSDLYARPFITDTATRRIWGDSIRTDSAGHVLVTRDTTRPRLFFALDTLKAPLVVADSGRLGFGIRVTADSLATAAFGTTDPGLDIGPDIRWYYSYIDTSATPDTVVRDTTNRGPRFDSFVFDPPIPPLDSNLAVGGVPSARSLVRVKMPAFLRDSFDVVRATVILVPAAAATGSPADSFTVFTFHIQTDLGAKSPPGSLSGGRVVIHPGSTDTVRIEVTDLVRAWTNDTTLKTAFFLAQSPEATSFNEIRFFSSRAPAFRPALHVTYVKRFPVGEP